MTCIPAIKIYGLPSWLICGHMSLLELEAKILNQLYKTDPDHFNARLPIGVYFIRDGYRSPDPYFEMVDRHIIYIEITSVSIDSHRAREIREKIETAAITAVFDYLQPHPFINRRKKRDTRTIDIDANVIFNFSDHEVDKDEDPRSIPTFRKTITPDQET